VVAKVTERDPILRIWLELTCRAITPAQRTQFLLRFETRALHELLLQHGPDWMKTQGRRALGKDGKGEPRLKLSRWLSECYRHTPAVLPGVPELGGHPPRPRRVTMADLPSTQRYEDDT
jgi:hypothetical protein